MPKILISYRRSDTAGVAGRIFDRLVARYGHESIFMDVDHIPFGIDFRDHIRDSLLAGDVLLAIVGGRWLGPRTGERTRMHDPNDPVRVEIETALGQGLPLIPVLVDGAAMPTPDDLPEALAKFAYLNAAPVDIGRDFHQHMDRVIRTIDRAIDGKGGAAVAGAALAGAGYVSADPAPSASAPATPRVVAPPARRKGLLPGAVAAVAAVIVALGLALWSGPSREPVASSPRAPAAPPSGRPIRIGLAAALSGPGEPIGKEVALAMKIWREDTNVRGGLLGRPVELVLRDDEGQPFNAPSLLARLLELDKVDVLISAGSGFSISLALPDIVKTNKLLFGLFGPGANQNVNYPKYFGMTPAGADLRTAFTRGFFAVALAQNPKPRSVAVSAVDEDACKEISQGARDEARANSLPIVYDDTYAMDAADFAPVVRAIAAANPDMVFHCSFSGDAKAFVRAVADAGFKPKMIGGVMPELRSAAVKAELGSLLNGFVNYEYWLPVPKMQFPGVAELRAKYQVRAAEEGADPISFQAAAFTYALLQVLQQAMEAARSTDDNRLADTIRATTFKTVVGDVSFGDKGEWATPRILQVQFQDILGHDVEQFREARTQVVVGPEAYKSGSLVYPFSEAQK